MIKRSLEEIFSDIQVDVLPVKSSFDITAGAYDLLIAGKPYQENTFRWRYDQEAEAVPLFLLLDHREKDSFNRADFAAYNLKEVFVKPFEPRSLADEILKLYPYVKLRPNIQKPLADFNALDFEVFSAFKKQSTKDIHSDKESKDAKGQAAKVGVFAADYAFLNQEPAAEKSELKPSMSDAWSLKLDERQEQKSGVDSSDSSPKPLSVVENGLKPLKEPQKLKEYGQKLFDQITSNIFTSADDKKDALMSQKSAAKEDLTLSEQLGSYFSDPKPKAEEPEKSSARIGKEKLAAEKVLAEKLANEELTNEQLTAGQITTEKLETKESRREEVSLRMDAEGRVQDSVPGNADEAADDSWGKDWHHPFDREEAKDSPKETLQGYETGAAHPKLEVQNLVAFFTDKKIHRAPGVKQDQDSIEADAAWQAETSERSELSFTHEAHEPTSNKGLKSEEKLAAFLIDPERTPSRSSAASPLQSGSDQEEWQQGQKETMTEELSPEMAVARKKLVRTQEVEKTSLPFQNLAEVDFSKPKKVLAEELAEAEKRALSEKEGVLMFDTFAFEQEQQADQKPWVYDDPLLSDQEAQRVKIDQEKAPAKTDQLQAWEQAAKESLTETLSSSDQPALKSKEELFPDFISVTEKSSSKSKETTAKTSLNTRAQEQTKAERTNPEKTNLEQTNPKQTNEEQINADQANYTLNYTDEEELLEKSRPSMVEVLDAEVSHAEQAARSHKTDRLADQLAEETANYDKADEVLDTIPASFDLDLARLQGKSLEKGPADASEKLDDSLMDVALNFYVDPAEHQANTDYNQMLQDIIDPKPTAEDQAAENLRSEGQTMEAFGAKAEEQSRASYEAASQPEKQTAEKGTSSPLREKFDSEVQQLKTDLATTFPDKGRRASDKIGPEASSTDLMDQFESFKENPPAVDEDSNFDPATMGVASNDLATVLDWQKDPSVPLPPSLKKEDVIRHLKSLQQQDPKIDAKKAADYLRMIEEHIKQAEEHSRISKMMLKEFQSLEQ